MKHLGEGRVKRKLLSAKPYDSRMKKTNPKKNSRQPTLDLSEEDAPQTIAEYVKRQDVQVQRALETVKPYVSQRDRTSIPRPAQLPSCVTNSSSHTVCQETPTSVIHGNSTISSAVKIQPKAPESSDRTSGCLTLEEVEKQRKAMLYIQARGYVPPHYDLIHLSHGISIVCPWSSSQGWVEERS